jgi:hypothetical protein
VPGDGRSRLVQIRLQLLAAADFSEQFVTPVGENPVDVLVFPVARGGDQFPQLVRICDASRRHLADSRRASLEHPLADRGPVSGGDGLREARFFILSAGSNIGGRRRAGCSVRLAYRRCDGRGRRFPEQA